MYINDYVANQQCKKIENKSYSHNIKEAETIKKRFCMKNIRNTKKNAEASIIEFHLSPVNEEMFVIFHYYIYIFMPHVCWRLFAIWKMYNYYWC